MRAALSTPASSAAANLLNCKSLAARRSPEIACRRLEGPQLFASIDGVKRLLQPWCRVCDLSGDLSQRCHEAGRPNSRTMIPLLVILVSIFFTAGVMQISCLFPYIYSGQACEETPCF